MLEKRMSLSALWGMVLVILVAVVWPRLCLLSGYPAMDEGSYAFISRLSWQNMLAGEAPPAMYGFSAYPLFLAWLYALPGPPWLWFRLADAIFAIAGAVLLCRILMYESGNVFFGLAAAFAALCLLNSGQVIDSGYKNSISAGLLFLYWAYWRGACPGRGDWFFCGFLAALAVVFREPFIVFALTGFFAIWRGYGLRAAMRFGAGGVVTGVAALLFFQWLGWSGGGLGAYLDGYLERGIIYAGNSGRIMPNFVNYAWQSVVRFPGMAALGLCAIFLLPLARVGELKLGYRLAFWLACALAPLLEPLTKLGFLYHFAVCLPGLAGFCAVVWRALAKGAARRFGRFVLSGAAFCACALGLAALPGPALAAMGYATLARGHGVWPEEYARKAIPLLAAREITRGAKPGDTLAASGFSFYLYYITGLMPPRQGWFDPADSYRLADLSRSFALMGRDGKRLETALASNPPTIIAVGVPASAHEADYNQEIIKAINDTGLYEETGAVPANPDFYYGWIGYRVFKLKNRPSGLSRVNGLRMREKPGELK